MTQPAIPEEQRARLQPALDELLLKLRTLADRLPEGAESALVFHPGREERE